MKTLKDLREEIDFLFYTWNKFEPTEIFIDETCNITPEDLK